MGETVAVVIIPTEAALVLGLAATAAVEENKGEKERKNEAH